MKTVDEIEKVIGEGELAYVSMEYFSLVGARVSSEKKPLGALWTELLAFQNGWVACKEHLAKLNDNSQEEEIQSTHECQKSQSPSKDDEQP